MKYLIRFLIVLIWSALIFRIIFIEHKDPDQEDGITVFTWSGLFDEEAVKAFEISTGIKVNLNYYDSNEELFVKLKTTGGKGYDCVLPSDYAVRMLIDEDLLQPIDKSKLHFIPHLNVKLLGHDFDPKNEYSLPFQWEIYGFGINPLLYPSNAFTWSSLFEDQGYRVAMTRDPVEAVSIAATYLFGEKESLTPSETAQVKALLTRQKRWVETYSAVRADYVLATNNCALSLSPSSFVFMTQKTFPELSFELPEKYSFISIENVALPKASKKQKQVYAFLNAMYEPKTFAKTCDEYLLFPATDNVLPHMEKRANYARTLREMRSRRLYFFDNLISEAEIRRLWVDIKAP